MKADIGYKKRKKAIAARNAIIRSLHDLLINAEIDALNEPELLPVCKRGRRALKLAKGEK